MIKPDYSDIIGNKIGRWEVLRLDDPRASPNPKRIYYVCQCRCGTIKSVRRDRLTKPTDDASCGCKQRERASQLRLDRGVRAGKSLYQHLKNIARKRNLDFTLSRNNILNLISKNCYYCGDSPKQVYKVKRRRNKKFSKDYDYIYYNGIDRIDSKVGYIDTNVVPCCKKCNYAKHILSLDDFFDHIIKIFNHNNLDKRH